MNEIDIGVSIPYRDSAFMDSIMASDIADSGLDKDDVYDVYDMFNEQTEEKDLEEFENFLIEVGINPESFWRW